MRLKKVSGQQGTGSAVDAFGESIHPVLTCCYRYFRVRIQSFARETSAAITIRLNGLRRVCQAESAHSLSNEQLCYGRRQVWG
jgi:hypothetical protein